MASRPRSPELETESDVSRQSKSTRIDNTDESPAATLETRKATLTQIPNPTSLDTYVGAEEEEKTGVLDGGNKLIDPQPIQQASLPMPMHFVYKILACVMHFVLCVALFSLAISRE